LKPISYLAFGLFIISALSRFAEAETHRGSVYNTRNSQPPREAFVNPAKQTQYSEAVGKIEDVVSRVGCPEKPPTKGTYKGVCFHRDNYKTTFNKPYLNNPRAAPPALGGWIKNFHTVIIDPDFHTEGEIDNEGNLVGEDTTSMHTESSKFESGANYFLRGSTDTIKFRPDPECWGFSSKVDRGQGMGMLSQDEDSVSAHYFKNSKKRDVLITETIHRDHYFDPKHPNVKVRNSTHIQEVCIFNRVPTK
jgi:hypothetical protein